MRITVKDDIAALAKNLQRIRASAIPTATTQALNRTARGVRTDATKELRKESGMRASEVRAGLKVWKATKLKQVAEVNARLGMAKNLIEFVSPSQRKPNYFNYRRQLKRGGRGKYRAKGVKARSWGKKITYGGTFIGKGKRSGVNIVYARTGKKRTPLKAIRGPSIRNMFDKKSMQRKLKQYAAKRFSKNMVAAVKNQIRIAERRNNRPS